MSKTKSIKIKAAILTLVFGLNTIIGFACSIGIDMGFNAKHSHHDDNLKAKVHIHDDGKKHIHDEKKPDHKKSHSHNGNKKSHSEEKKDNCCTDQVKKFEELDKSIPQGSNIIHPVFLIAYFDVFYKADLRSNDVVKDIKQFLRSYHPPIPDVRIAIRSFQI